MVDRYTKIVLTVIAICLVTATVRDTFTNKAVAQIGGTHVILDSVSQFAFQFATVPVRVSQ